MNRERRNRMKRGRKIEIGVGVRGEWQRHVKSAAIEMAK